MRVNEICNLGPSGTARKTAKALPSASAAHGHLFPCVDVRPRLSQSLPVPPLSLWELGRGWAPARRGLCLKPVASFPKVVFSVL